MIDCYYCWWRKFHRQFEIDILSLEIVSLDTSTTIYEMMCLTYSVFCIVTEIIFGQCGMCIASWYLFFALHCDGEYFLVLKLIIILVFMEISIRVAQTWGSWHNFFILSIPMIHVNWWPNYLSFWITYQLVCVQMIIIVINN